MSEKVIVFDRVHTILTNRERRARSSQRVLRRLLEIGWGIWYHIRDFKAMEESCG